MGEEGERSKERNGAMLGGQNREPLVIPSQWRLHRAEGEEVVEHKAKKLFLESDLIGVGQGALSPLVCDLDHVTTCPFEYGFLTHIWSLNEQRETKNRFLPSGRCTKKLTPAGWQLGKKTHKCDKDYDVEGEGGDWDMLVKDAKFKLGGISSRDLLGHMMTMVDNTCSFEFLRE